MRTAGAENEQDTCERDGEEWDVIVVGGGPAGSAAALGALQADPTARVLILDRAEFPRDKVCGDGVAPHALDVLAGLGVDVDTLVAGYAPITRLRLVSPGGHTAARPLGEPAWVIPRLVFDARLMHAALDRGAVLRRHVVRDVVEDEHGVVVDDRIRARVLIGADGAESVVRRQTVRSGHRTNSRSSTGRSRTGRRGTVALAVRGYADAPAGPGGEQLLTMTRRHWPAYAWVFPIGDGRVNVGYGELLGAGPHPTRADLLERLHDLLPGIDPGPVRGHRLPLSTGRPHLADGRVLLAGDAASLINPFTGEGIYYAILSGARGGAAAVTALDPGRAYRRALGNQLRSHLRQTDLVARLGRWPVVIDAGVAAARDRQTSFDTLVDIGLGSGRLDARTMVDVLKRVHTRRMAKDTEADVPDDPRLVSSRATGGVPDPDDPEQGSTTSTSETPDFVGRIAGDDAGDFGESGAERRAAADN